VNFCSYMLVIHVPKAYYLLCYTYLTLRCPTRKTTLNPKFLLIFLLLFPIMIFNLRASHLLGPYSKVHWKWKEKNKDKKHEESNVIVNCNWGEKERKKKNIMQKVTPKKEERKSEREKKSHIGMWTWNGFEHLPILLYIHSIKVILFLSLFSILLVQL
jgi:hypothetical protein